MFKKIKHQKKVMQPGQPKLSLLPNTALPTGLSDSSKAHQGIRRVLSAVDLSIALTGQKDLTLPYEIKGKAPIG